MKTNSDIPGEKLGRLLRLENAVLNYGGGIESLQKRLQLMAEQDNPHGECMTRLLYELTVYLRDVAVWTLPTEITRK